MLKVVKKKKNPVLCHIFDSGNSQMLKAEPQNISKGFSRFQKPDVNAALGVDQMLRHAKKRGNND